MTLQQPDRKKRLPSSLLALIALGSLGLPSRAQDAKLEDLEKRIEALEADHESEQQALQQQLDQAINRLRALAAPAGQAISLFNPAVTVLGTFIARTDDKPVFEYDNPSGHRLDDRFSLREAELDLRAPIAPWADGVMVISIEPEDGGYEVGIEEGFVVLRRLPLLDTAPAGLRLKTGQFRVSFNQLNRVHLHDLPQPFYPRSLRQFLGPHGLSKAGISGQFFLPTPSDSMSLQATVEILNGGDVPPLSTSAAQDTSVVGQLRSYTELSAASTFDLGASAWTDGPDRSLYGIDATYQWLPPSQGTWRSLLIGGEAYLGDFNQVGLDDDPLGYNIYAQYQFDTSTYISFRYDYSEQLDNTDLETRTYGLFVTRYAAEFLRFRLGYERSEGSYDVVDGLDSGFFEVNFIYGAHPADPYWVNR